MRLLIQCSSYELNQKTLMTQIILKNRCKTNIVFSEKHRNEPTTQDMSYMLKHLQFSPKFVYVADTLRIIHDLQKLPKTITVSNTHEIIRQKLESIVNIFVPQFFTLQFHKFNLSIKLKEEILSVIHMLEPRIPGSLHLWTKQPKMQQFPMTYNMVHMSYHLYSFLLVS